MGKRHDGMPVVEHKLKQNKEELKWVSDKRDWHKNRQTDILLTRVRSYKASAVEKQVFIGWNY